MQSLNKSYKEYPSFHDAISRIKKYIEKYKNEPYLEIEFRLGYIEPDEFKTDIGKEFYDRIMSKLIDCELWTETSVEKSEDYFYSGRRLTIIEDEINKKGYVGTCIKKEKLTVLDFTFVGSGFDVRVSFSREVPCKRFSKDKCVYKRIKDRNSFRYTNEYTDLSYDLTKVTMEDNTVEDHFFEVELEINNLELSKASSHYIAHNCLLKLKDIIEMCEEIDEDFKVEFKKEKHTNF